MLKDPVRAGEDELLSDSGLARPVEVDEDFRDHLAAGSQLQQGHSPVKGSKRTLNNYVQDDGVLKAHEGDQEIGPKQNHGFTPTLSPRHSIAQREAYYKMLDYLDNDIWTPIGLISTGDNHTELDKEL